ncbi:hypothetical protein B0H13DRAFT_2305823 [Mycena leptocephala]|nr:hypothetical protein B0H13DRAFT_2305823 [Mycena leptocephala]
MWMMCLSEEMTLDEIEEWRILPLEGRDANRYQSPPPRRAEYRAPSPYRRPSWTDSARRPFARSGYNRSPDKRSLDRCSTSWTDSLRRQLARYSRSPSTDRRSPDRRPSWTDSPRKPLARYNRSLSTDRRTFADDSTIATKMSVSEDRFEGTRSLNPVAAGDSNLDLEYYGPPPPPPAMNENTSIVARLTHEYWDTRRDMANAAVQGVLLENQLRTLGASAFLEEEQASDLDLAEQVRRMGLEVEEERVRLKTAEGILADVLRECETPMVVPELLKIVRLWEECDSPMSDD